MTPRKIPHPGSFCNEDLQVRTLWMRLLPVSGRVGSMTNEDRNRIARFWRKYLRLTRGRVSALRALEVIGDEERDESFRHSVKTIRRMIEDGSTISEAMSKASAGFSLSVIELVKTAEKTGAWDEILQEIVDGLEDGTFD
ncbi:MAG: hypothetical protein C0404_10000 [Verrucomicrobia bacterium]|nr:hypothetical protein [Verrucomicrobiota bacterium]